jgi:hypothetical protein
MSKDLLNTARELSRLSYSNNYFDSYDAQAALRATVLDAFEDFNPLAARDGGVQIHLGEKCRIVHWGEGVRLCVPMRGKYKYLGFGAARLLPRKILSGDQKMPWAGELQTKNPKYQTDDLSSEWIEIPLPHWHCLRWQPNG